jgi:hypothetical protein
MKTAHRSILFLTLVIALLVVSTSVVFAKELGLLTISGPGIKGEVTLKDPEAMLDLEKAGFFDTAILTNTPKDLGEGYNITAHLNLDGKMVPYIQMVYFPTNEGQPGYVHYTGRLEGEALQTINEWHILNRNADGALRDLLTANHIIVQSALITAPPSAPVKESVSAPAVEPVGVPAAPIPAPGMILAAVAGILALTGLALALHRRNTSPSAT